MKVEVGDTIKSYDFVNNTDYYYVGVVTEIKNELIYCDTISRTVAGDESKHKKPTFQTVAQGGLQVDGMYPQFSRIVILKKHNE